MNAIMSFLAGVWPINKLLVKKLKNQRPTLIAPEFEVPESLVVEDLYYNPDYYPTKETALRVRDKFGAMVAFSKAILDNGKVAPPQWFVRFSDGTEINAGNIAKFFAMYPEEKYPGVAFNLGVNIIAMERIKREQVN